MQRLDLKFDGRHDPTVMCLGAHSDDLEIGACGTLLGLVERFPGANICWIVFGASGARAKEARESAEYCTRGSAKAHIEIHGFADGLFPAELVKLKAVFESLKAAWRPDIILTHYRGDLHQDHRVVSDLTFQTFRNHLILEYEIPKYDGDLGSPNVFYPLSDALRDEKLSVLDRFFVSQKKRSWFTSDTFASLMRLRGMECNAGSGFAEAFYCRKIVLQ